MKNWIPCELHTHTVHSDGRQTLLELAEKAAKAGLKCIALTDHNTISGNMEKESIMKQTGIQIISGMEWTTFHGHMPILGIKKYEDWRNLEINTIDEAIKKVHNQGAIAGVAHPFRVGSPLCTGCYWEYIIKDWNLVDYIEVMSTDIIYDKSSNARAIDFWTELLSQGYRPTAVYGHDWHTGGFENGHFAVTYLGLDTSIDDMDNAVICAIKHGSSVVSLGPLLLMEYKSKRDGKTYSIGDEVLIDKSDKDIEITAKIDYSIFINRVNIGRQMNLVIKSNIGEIAKIKTDNKTKFNFNIPSQDIKWVRAELYGLVDDYDSIIALTNPIYIKLK